MNKLFNISLLVSALILGSMPLFSQNNGIARVQSDSVALKDVIQAVVRTNPSVKAAEEAVNNAKTGIGLAKSGYYPDADITAAYSNIGPVTKLTIPDFGTFSLFPNNNYSASVNYRQSIWDFGRTKQNIKMENENVVINEQSLEQVKQKLAMAAIGNFYTLVYLQAAIGIKDEQIAALNEHLSYVEKLMATGSATEYQALSTRVRISTVESQKVDLTAAIASQQAVFNSLTGNESGVAPVVRNELTAEMPSVSADSMLAYAFNNRDEVLLNQSRASLAEIRYGMARLQNRPNLNFQASAGAKNGYIPNLNELKPNYAVGIGLRVPLLDVLKNRYRISQAKSAITSISYEGESVKRNISAEVLDAEAGMNAAKQKVSQFELQLSQASKAYSLAETSFKSGTITNLDLLDANTAVSESRLLLLKARIDYVTSIYKLKAALGQRIY